MQWTAVEEHRTILQRFESEVQIDWHVHLCQVNMIFLQQENDHQDVGNYLTTYGEDTQYSYSRTTYICMCICWPLPSNQSVYRLVAGYWRGVGDHRVG